MKAVIFSPTVRRPAPLDLSWPDLRSLLLLTIFYIFFVSFGLAAAVPRPLWAGTISPSLARRMSESTEPASVIVHLKEQAQIVNLNAALKLRRASRAERHRETVQALRSSARSQQPLLAYLEESKEAHRVLGYKAYWISNLVVVRALPDEIARIASRPDVDWVEPHFKPVLIPPIDSPSDLPELRSDRPNGSSRAGREIPPGLRAIRAPEVWRDLGITGQGRLLANLDTGVDGNHPALRSRWRGRDGLVPWRQCWFDPARVDTFPADGNGHGTAVMGIMTGLGAETGDTVGVAWGADWIACNAIASGHNSEDGNEIIEAYQWFADPDGDPTTTDDVPDVVQNSWGVSMDEPDYRSCDSRWWVVIDNCEAAGVVTVWSAGNSGPARGTMIVPADRATTPTNTFSVGAVDARGSYWPYPMATFSSRGPTLCPGPEESRIKPEVVAPGVNIYSCIPGGGYRSNWSGTSLSGPHVAGVVALMRQANPDLDPDTIKRILMETARDESAPGEDNDFGWGFIDAYAAVQRALMGFGRIEGEVHNGSFQDAPLPGAWVSLLPTERRFSSDRNGYYHGSAAPATYIAVAAREGFAPDTQTVVLEGGRPLRLDFRLSDVAGPMIDVLETAGTTTDTLGPYPIRFAAYDLSSIASVTLHFRLNEGIWTDVPVEPTMRSLTPAPDQPDGNLFVALLPGAVPNTLIDYYIEAVDGIGQVTEWPEGAPALFASLQVRRAISVTGFEEVPATGWQVGGVGDAATSGVWVQADPVGTEDSGHPMQPAADHTPDPGHVCFVTGNGPPGGPAGDNDVDGGCTTLYSPIFDIAGDKNVVVTYWRWYAMGVASADDTLRIDASPDGGVSWVPLERLGRSEPSWREVSISLVDFLPGASQVQFRFRACDLGARGVVEAALDDFSLTSFSPPRKPADGGLPGASLTLTLVPNPSRGAVSIGFHLSVAAMVRIALLDTGGRRVRSYGPIPLGPGPHQVVWNLRNQSGRPVAAGRYFCRIAAGSAETTGVVTVVP